MENPRTPEENRERVYGLANELRVRMPSDAQKAHGKDSPEGFVFITNIGDPPMERPDIFGYESEAEFADRLKSELGDDVVFTTPAYDIDGRRYKGTAVHVRSGVPFVMHKLTTSTEGN